MAFQNLCGDEPLLTLPSNFSFLQALKDEIVVLRNWHSWYVYYFYVSYVAYYNIFKAIPIPLAWLVFHPRHSIVV